MNQKVSLHQIIHDCIEILKFKSQMKNVALTSTIPKEFPSEVLLDGNRVKQILINLISNAVKYTEEGSVKV